ncbi:MAG: helix-turn-helix transcriptional regulator [Myxococcales bacterium]|nr:helix-turn-helix transcriptional regulator [Myxococcales bacterium]
MNRRGRGGPGTVARGHALTVALRALRLLRTGRWRVEELAAELCEHQRTVYRLLRALERAGIRVEAQREGQEVYHRVRRETLEAALGLRAPSPPPRPVVALAPPRDCEECGVRLRRYRLCAACRRLRSAEGRRGRG